MRKESHFRARADGESPQTLRTLFVYGWEGSTMILLPFTLAEPQHFSLWEKLLLATLIVVSGALFWRRFGAVLDRILKSKKDPDFHIAPIGRRIWDFFSQVLLQSKVIRQRPLPGIAHALVFWGFCAFVLVTLNHFAAGFGAGFLAPGGFFGRFYFWFRRRLRARLRGGNSRSLHPALSCSPALAGPEALLGVRLHRPADLRADGHLPGRVLHFR